MRAVAVLEELGIVEIPDVLTGEQCADLAIAVDGADARRAGSRNLLDLPSCRELAATFKEHSEIGRLFPAGSVAVQCTLFDKSPDKNWLVALHQDLSIPVLERIPHRDCTGWSEKEGVVYVQPPVAVLESLVAVRAHLDDCGTENGPLRVVPRSHRHGRLSADVTKALREQYGEVECTCPRGGVVVMRPLLLHSSSRARTPSRRRVLHFLFGPRELTGGLRWHRAV
jgi:ectoine hydroxylase-related dioxygenase (phytanoyl-CoA dioxygenase family)